LIRETRARNGLSQQRLARRVGSHQSAISRIEADEISPSVETLDLLMRAMGERLQLIGASLKREYDPVHRRATAARPLGERLALGISWNRTAGRLALAGKRPVAGPDTPLDAERIFRALAEHGVEYVLIGGLAVQTHGHVRTTNHADLIPAPDPANLKRLAAALLSLDARVLNPGKEDTTVDAKMLPKATIWQFAR
jgi:transcriptional regulator with XRE-family HTH domain